MKSELPPNAAGTPELHCSFSLLLGIQSSYVLFFFLLASCALGLCFTMELQLLTSTPLSHTWSTLFCHTPQASIHPVLQFANCHGLYLPKTSQNISDQAVDIYTEIPGGILHKTIKRLFHGHS